MQHWWLISYVTSQRTRRITGNASSTQWSNFLSQWSPFSPGHEISFSRSIYYESICYESQFSMDFLDFVSWESIIVYLKCLNVSHTFNIWKGKQNFDLCQLSGNLWNKTKVRLHNSLSGLFLKTFKIKFVSNLLCSQKKKA